MGLLLCAASNGQSEDRQRMPTRKTRPSLTREPQPMPPQLNAESGQVNSPQRGWRQPNRPYFSSSRPQALCNFEMPLFVGDLIRRAAIVVFRIGIGAVFQQ